MLVAFKGDIIVDSTVISDRGLAGPARSAVLNDKPVLISRFDGYAATAPRGVQAVLK